MDDFVVKPPTPPDLGRGITVKFDTCPVTKLYRAKIHDGNVALTFAATHAHSYGEALAKALDKRKRDLGIVINNVVSRKQASN